jgi:hypothetical protein
MPASVVGPAQQKLAELDKWIAARPRSMGGILASTSPNGDAQLQDALRLRRQYAAEAEAERQAAARARIAASPRRPQVRSGRSVSRSGCEADHSIEFVSEDGTIIKLEDGSVWEVDDADSVVSSIWLPTSEVVVCEEKGTLINTDDNESVSVRRLK